MSKDPVQQLVDEITLIRGEVQALKRTSLDRDEAEALHGIVADAVERMASAAKGAPRALREALETDRTKTARLAVQSATEAAQGAVEGVRGQLEAERQEYARSLSEARREARRARLLSWPIVAAMLAIGALGGALGAFWIGGTISARDFGDHPGVFCTSAGGQRVTQSSGWTFCAVPIEGPE